VDLFPQLLGTALGEGVLGLQAAAQANHIGRGVTALDAFPAAVFSPLFLEGGDLLFAGLGHDASLSEVIGVQPCRPVRAPARILLVATCFEGENRCQRETIIGSIVQSSNRSYIRYKKKFSYAITDRCVPFFEV